MKGVAKDRAVPAGAAIGMAYSAKRLLIDNDNDGTSAPLTYLATNPYKQKLPALLQGTMARADTFARTDRYAGAVAGIVVSAAPKIPGVRVLAKPVDKAVRRVFKGKVSL